MRAAIGVVVSTLIFSLGYGLVGAQTRGDVPALDSIHMSDALTGWAVTDQPDADALLRTRDGGIHWTDVTPRSSSGRRITVADVAVLDSLTAWVPWSEGISGETSHIFHTVDGGRTWRAMDFPGRAGALHFINAHDGWMLANGFGALGSEEVDVYRTTDGGETWIKMSGTESYSHAGYPPGGPTFAGGKIGITFLNATTGWITGGGNVPNLLYIYATRDGGRTWRQETLPLPPGLSSRWSDIPTPPRFFSAQDGVLLVFYWSEDPATDKSLEKLVVFYVTHDAGATWSLTTPLPVTKIWDRPSGFADVNLRPTTFADVNHGLVPDGDTLYMTTDGGRRWTASRPVPPFGDVKQLDFVSPQIGWAVRSFELSEGGRQTPPFLLQTLDGGQTWKPVTYTISER